jgi:hypothetical protein
MYRYTSLVARLLLLYRGRSCTGTAVVVSWCDGVCECLGRAAWFAACHGFAGRLGVVVFCCAVVGELLLRWVPNGWGSQVL